MNCTPANSARRHISTLKLGDCRETDRCRSITENVRAVVVGPGRHYWSERGALGDEIVEQVPATASPVIQQRIQNALPAYSYDVAKAILRMCPAERFSGAKCRTLEVEGHTDSGTTRRSGERPSNTNA
jgi:hypothetical protein